MLNFSVTVNAVHVCMFILSQTLIKAQCFLSHTNNLLPLALLGSDFISFMNVYESKKRKASTID